MIKRRQQFSVNTLGRRYDVSYPRLKSWASSLHVCERWRRYAKRHEDLWVDFTEEAVRRTGMTELVETDGLTKDEFADGLKELE